MIATLIRTLRSPRDGVVQKLYKLSEALMNREGELGYRFVVVSAARHNDWPGTAMGVHETYIFGATPEGEVLNWGDLAGSVTGHTNHALALSDIGYTVVEGPGI